MIIHLKYNMAMCSLPDNGCMIYGKLRVAMLNKYVSPYGKYMHKAES